MFAPDELRSRVLPWAFCLWMAALPARSGAADGLLRAGAAATDVTPEDFPVIANCMFEERQADQAHDRLHARSLVLDDGATRLSITVVDSCMMPRDLLDDAKALAAGAGIPRERMLIAATHTHSAPAAMACLGSDAELGYRPFLVRRIAESIERAAANLEPARIGWTVAPAPEHTHCRRWITRPDRLQSDPFGERNVRAMMHPGHQNPDFIGPAGPVDPDLPLLSVQSRDGRPIAVLANYSMHYFGSEPLSADYFGLFAEKLARLCGAGDLKPPFVAILSQGTSGDLQWMDYARPRPAIGLDAYTEAIARLAHEALKKIDHSDAAPLSMREATLTLGVRLPSPERLAWAREVVAKLAGKKPRSLPEIYAREQLFLSEKPLHELKLQAVRIGGLGIAAMPNEVFGITGLRIKAQSPLVPTFNIELANGAEGYIPPPEQHRLGGYTTWPARTAGLEVEAETKIVAAVLELLEAVSGMPRRPLAEENGPYARAILASRPLAYWRLSEFNGQKAVDASGRGNDARYEGGVAFYLDGPESASFSGPARLNRSPHFAGGRLDARVRGIGSRYSVELWFWNGLPAGARPVTGYLVSRGSGDQLGIGGAGEAAGMLFFSTGDGGKSLLLRGKTEVPLKTWTHVVMSRDEKTVAVYLDGRAQPEIAGEAPPVLEPGQDDAFILGAGKEGDASFEGKLDEVAIYDRPLEPEEVAKHYGAFAGK